MAVSDPVHVRNLIGGAFRAPAGERLRAIVDPASGATIAQARDASTGDVDDAVRAAVAAGRGWAECTPAERADALLRLAAVVEQNDDELAAIEQRNVGKPGQVAALEPALTVDVLRFFAGAARVMEGVAAGEYTRDVTTMVRRDPVGVVGCIVPWNYPLSTAAAKFAPALAAGNTVVVKPSELTPLSLLRLCELAEDVLPPGVLNVVVGDGATAGARLAAHPGVAMISMTGSPRAGRLIAAAAAPTMKRLHLELGGNAPVVVFPDADVDALAQTLRLASFWNSGQECGAAARVLVHRDAAATVRDALAEMIESVAVGAPDDEEVEVGPVVSAAQRTRLADLVGGAVRAGASTAGTRRALPDEGFYVAPTLVWDVEQSDPIVQQETFGPVITLQQFGDEDEAIALANGTPYGLSGSIWSADVARGLRLARTLRCGTTWINTHMVASLELPWGGLGDSGGGRDASIYALEDHTIARNVSVALGSPS
ncbi:aldehyde dehydrogenase family protein [Conexibacter stalactiti]|uniref:aldehyde dehydrogenase (NAD(+)) n=1 Tax=Conexibacter stalactiti TaxID=1940611 RepID=A0ABU4HXP2_9ACTN|nr:aldehyde dehydrogenase family protein [Conexibacter stalactiti]MDW5597629.1 aldehyde dehydrogenase family protein [Conexibacter stalactiti]MEC5038271.1 aldehyde dehydrogenase family protein [Conexibacter stalactiti]